jgi:hypothetical protein
MKLNEELTKCQLQEFWSFLYGFQYVFEWRKQQLRITILHTPC